MDYIIPEKPGSNDKTVIDQDVILHYYCGK